MSTLLLLSFCLTINAVGSYHTFSIKYLRRDKGCPHRGKGLAKIERQKTFKKIEKDVQLVLTPPPFTVMAILRKLPWFYSMLVRQFSPWQFLSILYRDHIYPYRQEPRVEERTGSHSEWLKKFRSELNFTSGSEHQNSTYPFNSSWFLRAYIFKLINEGQFIRSTFSASLAAIFRFSCEKIG